jgi:hypothetical protein
MMPIALDPDAHLKNTRKPEVCKYRIPSKTASSSSTSSLSLSSRPLLRHFMVQAITAVRLCCYSVHTLPGLLKIHCPFRLYNTIPFGILSTLSTRCIQFCLFSRILLRNNCIFTFFPPQMVECRADFNCSQVFPLYWLVSLYFSCCHKILTT